MVILALWVLVTELVDMMIIETRDVVTVLMFSKFIFGVACNMYLLMIFVHLLNLVNLFHLTLQAKDGRS
jgi:hypothetical protein